MQKVAWLPKVAYFVVLGLMILFFHSRVNEGLAALRDKNSNPFIPAPVVAKCVSLGFDQLLADYYWLEFVGYIGDAQREEDHCALADQYIELITALDPRFVQAYWFAAFIIGGEQGRPERADELIQRGINANADNWYLPFIGGINQYLFAHNEVLAARYYRQAARFPDAPAWLERQAGILESHSPQLVKDANSWMAVFDSAQEPRVRERARERCIYFWIQVYKSAPTDAFREKARVALSALGVDIERLISGMKAGTKNNR